MSQRNQGKSMQPAARDQTPDQTTGRSRARQPEPKPEPKKGEQGKKATDDQKTPAQRRAERQEDRMPAQAGQKGLTTLQSTSNFATTQKRARTAVQRNKMKVVAQVDHRANARSAKMDIPPSKLFLINDPKMSAELIKAEPTMAIDLPLKMLVWEDEQGQTHVTYDDPEAIARRHGVTGKAAVVGQMRQTMQAIAKQTIGSEKAAPDKVSQR
jgi:uncharacterized protein (DUF302 family)